MRVKRGNAGRQKKKKVFKLAKGYLGKGKNLYKAAAHIRVVKAGVKSYRDRIKKKRDFRGLWIQRINAALIPFNVSYSKFINLLNKANVKLNRKMLSELAATDPMTFSKIVEKVNS